MSLFIIISSAGEKIALFYTFPYENFTAVQEFKREEEKKRKKKFLGNYWNILDNKFYSCPKKG